MNIEEFLDQDQHKSLLRFVFVGSVDDGKSTLIGRLLHDTQGVYEDQLEAVKKASTQEHGEIDFSLFTDGLKAEREQGITIDVAYRYFATSARKFIVADTPGHVQYTRNMVTGASTANVAVILIDARLGVLEQSKRHAYIASMLGIPYLAVAINKMDLKNFDASVFEDIRKTFLSFTSKFRFQDVRFFPISALEGDNVVTHSERTPWYDGETFLQYLESVPTRADETFPHLRYPVQYVLRPNLNYRGFSGQIAAGAVKKGDEVLVLPSGKKSRVKAIDTMDGELNEAVAPQSVTLRLEDEVDVSRGDMLVLPSHLPKVGRQVEANLVWMSETPLDPGKTYLMKHTTQSVRVQVEEVQSVLNPENLEEEAGRNLKLNDIAKVRITSRRAIYFDSYEDCRRTGAFVLIDSYSNATVAAGMIGTSQGNEEQDLASMLREARAGSALEPKTQVSSRERLQRFGQKGAVLWLVGIPGSGRWPLAYALERRLFDEDHTAHVLEPKGESLETMISAAKACAHAGLLAICAYPAYTSEEQKKVKAALAEEAFIEVFVDTDKALCQERRPKAKVDRFDAPPSPDLRFDLAQKKIADAVSEIVKKLDERGQFTK